MNTFSAAQFTPLGTHLSAEEKAKFANALVRFAEKGFPASLFTKFVYNNLNKSFGHVAHCDRGGFYQTWFADDAQRLNWLRYVERGGAYGPMGVPAFTRVDVQQVISAWVRSSGLLASYEKKVRTAVETAERALLAKLQAKYQPQESVS